MPGDIYFQLRSQLNDLRSEIVTMDGNEVPKSLRFLEELLAKETEPSNRFDIFMLLRDECLRGGYLKQEIRYARECAQESTEPLPWIGLADLLGTNASTLSDAVVAATEAVRLARERNSFYRHSLCSLGRALWRNSCYFEVAQVVEELLKDADQIREEEGPFDVDFVVDLPANAIDRSLRQEYLKLAEASRSNCPGRGNGV